MLSQRKVRERKRWPIVPIVVLLVSTLEVLLAERKHALFSGGFGQSRTLDEPAEILTFMTGYAVAQVFLGLLAWTVVRRLNKRQSNRLAAVNFAFFFGGAFVIALGVRYQLHSYFSDAVSFALLKQLGGGSILDALLYAVNEIAVAAGSIAVFLLVWAIVWLWLRRREPPQYPPDAARFGWRSITLTAVAIVTAQAVIPRTAGDAPYALERTMAWRSANQVLNALSDFDLDGYGLFARQFDRHPFDARRHPLAMDIPGNGVDEDGLAGDLTLVALPEVRPAARVIPRGRHVVIVVIESARADTVGKSIEGKVVAPNLNSIAAEGMVAVPSFSHVGFTTDSSKSIFTGRLIPQPGDASLFTELKRSGFRVGVFSSQAEDFGDISATVAMRESADAFVDAEVMKDKRTFGFAAKGSLRIDESHIVRELDAYLSADASRGRSHFIYVNLQSPHFPYHHPEMPLRLVDKPIPRDKISASNKEWTWRNYWNAIANADAWLGEVVTLFKRHGLWNETLLLVSGDHGESLFEDGLLGHGHVINEIQFATFLVSNQKSPQVAAPLSISEYRDVVLNWLTGEARARLAAPPFMHIGGLDRPTQIGMASTEWGIVSLRLDTLEACLEKPYRCIPYDRLASDDRSRIDALIRRWETERWLLAQRRQASKTP